MQEFEFQTERFKLHPALPRDLEAIKRILADPDVTKMLLGDVSTPQGVEKEARKWIDDDAFWQEHRLGSWGIFDRSGTVAAPDRLLGIVAASPALSQSSDGTEIFYFLHRDFWKKGVVYEAARAMIDYLFDSSGVAAVEAAIFAEANPASVGLSQKLGLKPAGRVSLREHGVDDAGLQEIVTFDLWRVRNADGGKLERILNEAAFRIGQTIAEGYGSLEARRNELVANVRARNNNSDRDAAWIEEKIVSGMQAKGFALFRCRQEER